MTTKQLRSLEVEVRLSFYNPESAETGIFDSSVARLLDGVDRLGSLNAAAKDVPVAYSKAWKSLRETEANLGFLLIDRDGARGSTLTSRGSKLLRTYKELMRQGSAGARQRFFEVVS